ncbi:MAG: EAL domain-containing protein [Gammaproteobacteria bacterium]|nr:EAL domain-containing protein [Gammaproteobacteria bacterium]
MPQAPVPLLVLTTAEDDVELINRTLRDAGHPVRCSWLKRVDALEEAIAKVRPQLLWYYADRFSVPIRDVAKLRQQAGGTVPLLVIRSAADENAITEALLEGAQDLVSPARRERLAAVAEREMRSYRLEQALNTTLHSASQYKKQLKDFLAGAADAIAYVQEGIVVEANQAWAELFGMSSADAIDAPLMDLFDVPSQAAVKGAVVACLKNQWKGEPLKVGILMRDGSISSLSLLLEPTTHDGEPGVKLSVPRETPERSAPEDLVEQTVHKDPTTGFYHRRRFIELLTKRLTSANRGGVRALAYIRPDKFGEIEDEVGPLASEDLLVKIADILRATAHAKDLCGRFGGNVFTMLLERGTLRDVEAWAEHAVSQISDHIFEVAENTLSISCTIGIAEVGPGTDRVEALVADAEKANQRGRQRGGNQAVLEETSDESTQIQRFDQIWVHQIKAALVENRFKLAHLPIASLSGDPKVLYDTVLKMVDEQGDEVPAADFIHAARRNKLLRAVDRWVIGATLEFCRKQQLDGVFVKLSHESMLDGTLLDWLGKQVQASGVSPTKICFQISEEDVTQYLKQTKALAEQLKALGFSFAIEHFGIGRDPMRVLTQMPLQYLKIDGSLMQSLATNQALQEKVRGFIKAAEKRKVLTIAERVEDANTMAVLFQLGAAYMQGHYLQEAEVVLEERE